MFHVTNPETGSRMAGYLNPHQASIMRRLRRNNPEKYKDDPGMKKILADIRAEEEKERTK